MHKPWIALVGPEFEENLSLRYLASSLARAGYRSEILAVQLRRAAPGPRRAHRTSRRSAAARRHLDGVPVARPRLARARASRCARRATAGTSPPAATSRPSPRSEMLRDFPELDSICRQEAEETLVELVRARRGGRAAGRDLPGSRVRDAPARPRINAHARRCPTSRRCPGPIAAASRRRASATRIAPLVSTPRLLRELHASAASPRGTSMALPGKRYRERPLEDVADEMADDAARARHRDLRLPRRQLLPAQRA